MTESQKRLATVIIMLKGINTKLETINGLGTVTASAVEDSVKMVDVAVATEQMLAVEVEEEVDVKVEKEPTPLIINPFDEPVEEEKKVDVEPVEEEEKVEVKVEEIPFNVVEDKEEFPQPLLGENELRVLEEAVTELKLDPTIPKLNNVRQSVTAFEALANTCEQTAEIHEVCDAIEKNILAVAMMITVAPKKAEENVTVKGVEAESPIVEQSKKPLYVTNFLKVYKDVQEDFKSELDLAEYMSSKRWKRIPNKGYAKYSRKEIKSIKDNLVKLQEFYSDGDTDTVAPSEPIVAPVVPSEPIATPVKPILTVEEDKLTELNKDLINHMIRISALSTVKFFVSNFRKTPKDLQNVFGIEQYESEDIVNRRHLFMKYIQTKVI